MNHLTDLLDGIVESIAFIQCVLVYRALNKEIDHDKVYLKLELENQSISISVLDADEDYVPREYIEIEFGNLCASIYNMSRTDGPQFSILYADPAFVHEVVEAVGVEIKALEV